MTTRIMRVPSLSGSSKHFCILPRRGKSLQHFSSASRLRQGGHKSYFQNQLRSLPTSPPLVYQSQAPPRSRLSGLLFANIVVCGITIYWALAREASQDEGSSFLDVQTKYHNADATSLRMLWMNTVSSICEGTQYRFFDAVRDPDIWSKRPLKLEDGTQVDESNAVLIKIYDFQGKWHASLVLVDTTERTNRRGRTQWMDNISPVQKWALQLELDQRKQAIEAGDPSGDSGGMDVYYMTNDTFGVGGCGPIASMGEEMHQVHPSRAGQAMMHCSPMNADEFQQHLALFRQMKTQRKEAPIGGRGKNLNVNIMGLSDGSKVLQIVQPDGMVRELARFSGDIQTRSEYEEDIGLEIEGEDGKTQKVPGALFTLRVLDEKNGAKVMSVKLPGGEIVKIGEAQGNVSVSRDGHQLARIDEVMPNGKVREIARLGREEYEKYGIPEGSEPKADIDN